MNEYLTQNISNNSNESVDTSVVKSPMESVPQQSQQTSQQSQQSAQQSPSAQLLIGQQMSPIVTSMEVSQQNQNSVNDSSTNSSVSVSINGNIISSNPLETQNSVSSNPSVTSSMASVSVSNAMSTQGSIPAQNTQQSPQLIVSSSQPQMAPTTQSTHLNVANGIMTHLSGATITSMASQPMQMSQTGQHNQMQPILQSSVQQTAGNQMSVTMSPLPQVQVIQQPIGGTGGTYQLQQVYQSMPQSMLLPGTNFTIQNMPHFATNQGLSLQIPFSGTGGISTGTMPITSIASKTPIMSKGVAISPLTQSQHLISPLKPNLSAQSAQQILKQVLPNQQFNQLMPHSSNQTVVFSQLLPQQNQHTVHQSILPNNNKGLMEAPKGKPFGTGSVRSAFGNKMLSHSTNIQPKSAILPATSISQSFMGNSQFKTQFATNNNTTQLISPSNLINPQILGSFQNLGPGLTWTTSPQSTHLVAPNGSPIFIRGPTQGGEHMFISTSNMSSPQLQAVSMSGPINVQNTVQTPIQVSTGNTQSSQMNPTLHMNNANLQTITVSSNSNTNTTTTPISYTQTQVTASSIATTANVVSTPKTKIIRQTSCAATQTASPASAQKVESTTNLKPIAPAKPKPSAQQLTQNNKQNSKETNTTTVRPSLSSTQTVCQSTGPPPQTKPQSNKSDASNQTNKVSLPKDISKVNSQVSSSRLVNDNNRHMTLKINNSSEISETKHNSVSESIPTKTPPKKAVGKKDASTEQDLELSVIPLAQNSQKSIQNSVQTTTVISNNVNQPNGQQIPVLSDLNRQDFSKQPQKAIVKPQKSDILTHVIDGYVIKESANPFPVNSLSFSSDTKNLNEEKTNNNSIDSSKSKNKNENSNATSSRIRATSEKLCLNCGVKRTKNSKHNKIKKFCSQLCSEKFNSNIKNSANNSRLVLYNSVTGHLDDNDLQRTPEMQIESNTEPQKSVDERKKVKSLKRTHENSSDSNVTKNGDLNIVNEPNHKKATPTVEAVPLVNSVPPNAVINEETTNSAIAGLYIPPGGRNPLQWTVNDVYQFVSNLQGCTEYADEFRSQEIDGQALMLIKEDHLMNTMNMKLGPALKICSKINALREDVSKQS